MAALATAISDVFSRRLVNSKIVRSVPNQEVNVPRVRPDSGRVQSAANKTASTAAVDVSVESESNHRSLAVRSHVRYKNPYILDSQ